jgi:hypothetical protein
LGLELPSGVVGAPLVGPAVGSAAAVAAIIDPQPGSGQELCVQHVKTFGFPSGVGATRTSVRQAASRERHGSWRDAEMTLVIDV